jgi:regulator of replication initiation timing/phosphotransferase system IIB component
MQTLKLLITQFNDEALWLSLLMFSFLFALFIAYWLYNRKKFHQLAHQIPAGVIKNYLDTIIQNSAALRSSLLRGADAGDIPAVFPIDQLAGHPGIEMRSGNEDIERWQAEITHLKTKLKDKEKVVQELERKMSDMGSGVGLSSSGNQEEVEILQAEVARLQKELEALRASSGAASGGSSAEVQEMQQKLMSVTKERDQLKERLMEYEIIEEDLANLKRLQSENEQLKKQLGGAAPKVEAPVEEEPIAEEVPAIQVEAVEAVEAVETVEEPAPEETPETPETPEPPAVEAAVSDDLGENREEKEKSSEELLSEFEKMLG